MQFCFSGKILLNIFLLENKTFACECNIFQSIRQKHFTQQMLKPFKN